MSTPNSPRMVRDKPQPPPVLPWHIEASKELIDNHSPISLDSQLSYDDIDWVCSFISKHDPNAETVRLLEQINAIAKIGVTDADKLYYQLRKASEGLTQKAAREELEKKLTTAGAMERKRNESSIIRIK